jgi:hypothetical protein
MDPMDVEWAIDGLLLCIVQKQSTHNEIQLPHQNKIEDEDKK